MLHKVLIKPRALHPSKVSRPAAGKQRARAQCKLARGAVTGPPGLHLEF